MAWRSYQGNDFHVLSKRTFFPIPAGKFKKIVTESVTDDKAKRILKHSYTLHASCTLNLVLLPLV